jgi:glycosyltransferase involved in cell wall biosynthesis
LDGLELAGRPHRPRRAADAERRVSESGLRSGEQGAEEPMRIGMMIETDGPGGAEVVFIQLSEELRRRGHTVIAVGPEKGRGWLSGRLAELGFERHTFSLKRAVDPGCLFRMKRMLGELDLDVVHSHEFTMAVYGTAACRMLGLPHVITMHGADSVFEVVRRRLALRWAMQNSSAMVAVSDHTRDYMCGRLHATSDQVITIRNGIPPQTGERERIRHEIGLKEQDVLIVAVGNLRPRKGHIILLRALVELDRQAAGQKVHVAIAGEGAEAEQLLAYANENGIGSRVHLLGLRRDIADVQAAADVSAMPSYWEGLPLAVLEGMFAGNPVVASNVGGIAEAITNGVEGFLVESGSVQQLASALKPLVEDPILRSRMGDAAFERAHREFHIAKMTERYLRLYRGESSIDGTR